MDLHKKYSLVKEHEGHFEIHDSTDGKRFPIAKKDLHPATQIKIMKMQKFADGGSVEGFDSGINVKDPGKDIYDQRPWYANIIGDTSAYDKPEEDTKKPIRLENYAEPSVADTSAPPMMDSSPAMSLQAPQSMPQTTSSTPIGTGQPASAPLATSGAPTVQSLQGIEHQYASGVNKEAQGQIFQNKEIAKAQEANLQLQQKSFEMTQANMQKYQAQADQLSQEIAAGKIDPNKFWSEKSSGSKIAAGLGIILSGIGAGLQGSTQNMALGVLQKQIDQDIDSQKANLGKKQTMLSDNLRMQGNLMQAEAATRLQYSAILQGQIAKIASQTSDPMILGKAQQMIAERKRQDIPLQQTLATADTRRNILNGSMSSGVSPEQKIGLLAKTPQEFENATKELQAVKNHAREKASILAAFDKVAEENTVAGKAGRLGFDPPSMAGFRLLTLPLLKDEAGRINERELEVTEGIMKGTLDRPGSVKEKRAALEKFVDAKAPVSSHLTAFGIDPKQFDVSQSSPVERLDQKSGKMALFDPETKKFLRWK